jgi:hypothetical protein
MSNKPRKEYCKPQLLNLGDMRSLTMGGSPGGVGDSGGGYFIEKSCTKLPCPGLKTNFSSTGSIPDPMGVIYPGQTPTP